MDWLYRLFTDVDSVAHIVVLYAFVVSLGVLLGKIKFGNISLGVTFILFVGIVCGHLGLTGNAAILDFVQNFGLILFVFCIGLQVGPSFFSSFKTGGLRMNMLALMLVVLNIVVTLLLYYALEGRIDIPMLTGIMCGAVTNTPGLGAANEALAQIGYQGGQIATGYACAYPLGVLGIIAALVVIRYVLRVNLDKENEEVRNQEAIADPHIQPFMMHLELRNQALDGMKLGDIKKLVGRDFIISRILQGGHVVIPDKSTMFHVGDQMFCVCAQTDKEAITAFIGAQITVDWQKQDMPMVSRRILVTRSKLNGKTLGELHFRSLYGVNVTRINRSGMDIFATHDLTIQVGDRVMCVGPQDAVDRVARKLGNELQRLDHPNILTIFVGILLGIVLGSLPIAFPLMPTPVKLGLAGGPLIVAILLGRFGYKLKLVSYTTMSANLMLREIGLALFLASVGIKAGAGFFEAVFQGDGLLYVACGALITIVPALVVGLFARLRFKTNYFTLSGVIVGATTNAAVLPYVNSLTTANAPSVGYSTVYPLATFLRIIVGQMLILFMA